ncbi:MAG TPA: exosortase S [Microbacteriaceae bacterium]|nr:exosortase S [Microbacteriaceae bacterium]
MTDIDQPSASALPWDEPEPVRGHFVIGLILIAVAAFLMIQQDAFKTVEASVTSWVLQFFTAGGTASAGDVVYYGLGTDSVNGLQITTLCSTVILVTPLLALAGVLLMLPRFRVRFVARGLGLALALVILCNFLRYCSAALAMQLAGREGFDVVHRYLGSVLVILGFAAAFILLLRIGANGRLRKRSSGRHE